MHLEIGHPADGPPEGLVAEHGPAAPQIQGGTSRICQGQEDTIRQGSPPPVGRGGGGIMGCIDGPQGETYLFNIHAIDLITYNTEVLTL